MEYIKVVGKDYQEALFEARRQYGPNIMPLSDRKIKVGGIMGSKLFAKVQVELTAAISDRDQNKPEWLNKKDKLESVKINWKEKEGKASQSLADTSAKNLQADAKKVQELESLLKAKAKQNPVASDANSLISSKDKFESVLAEAQKRQKMQPKEIVSKEQKKIEIVPDYDTILRNVSDIKTMLNEMQKKEGQGLHSGRYYDSPIDRWEKKLIESDFSPEYADHIISEVREKLTIEEINDREAIRKKILLALRNRIGISPPLLKSSEKRKIVAFFGATGVGKTTTLAKLGAIYTIYQNKKVAFITVDNYRIAATEQLKRYAEIISLPTHVVNSPEQLQNTISREEADLILIDTSGRSPYNEKHLQDIDDLFKDVQEPVEKVLVSAATAKRMDQQIIFESFSSIGIDKVIFSKLDESAAIGGLVETADKYNRGISYITFGQDVPSDIEEANAQKIAYLAMGERKKPILSTDVPK